MIKLIDLFRQKYGNMLDGTPSLEVGEYEVKRFWILDTKKHARYIYLDTDKGLFKSASMNLVRSVESSLGALMQEQFDKGETVFVEIVNKRKNTGKFGLAFRTV